MSVNIEDLTRENLKFEVSDIGREFLKHKNGFEILKEEGSSAFIGALYFKDDEEGMYSNRAISLTLIDDNEDYKLYMDTGSNSIVIDRKDYDEKRLEELCLEYRYDI